MEKILKQLLDISAKHQTLWFRGHSSINYKLNSGLYRINSQKTAVLNHENNIYNSFINLGAMHIDNLGAGDEKSWNTLFMMQHYGMYTRLLDWTSSFITALYFANLGRKPGEKAVIWAIDPIELNNKCHNLYENGIDNRYNSIGYVTIDTLPNRIKNYKNFFESNMHIKSFALMPRKSNERLVSQNGFFTVQGIENIPLDVEYSDHIDEFIYKIELSSESYEASMEYLKINGVDYYSLFGGVDGLCRYIKDELLSITLDNK